VKELLEPATLAEFRRNVGALNNRAVFEIPEIFQKLLGENGEGLEEETAGQASRELRK
jgi:1,2-diacylglycerol 3-beta-galactosyltransferase